MKIAIGYVMLAWALFGTFGCTSGPSEDDCRAACEEAASACTESDAMDKCVSRCQENADDDQVQYAKDHCGSYDVCSLGLCCAGFYYSESDDAQYCH